MHSTTPPFDHISTKCDTNQASWTSPGQISSLWNYYHRQLITTPFLNLAPAHTIVNISSYIQPKNIPSLHHWLMIHPSTSGQPEVRIWSTWTSLPTCQCGIFCLHRDHPEQNKHAPWKGGGEEIGSQNQRGKRATSWFMISELSWQFFKNSLIWIVGLFWEDSATKQLTIWLGDISEVNNHPLWCQ